MHPPALGSTPRRVHSNPRALDRHGRPCPAGPVQAGHVHSPSPRVPPRNPETLLPSALPLDQATSTRGARRYVPGWYRAHDPIPIAAARLSLARNPAGAAGYLAPERQLYADRRHPRPPTPPVLSVGTWNHARSRDGHEDLRKLHVSAGIVAVGWVEG